MVEKISEVKMVVEVWKQNLVFEIVRLSNLIVSHPYVAVDTEFSGFVKNTPFTATDADRYSDVKENVDSMKLIQLGITLCNHDGSSVHSWQFSFSDFHPSVNVHSEESIELLKKSGIDFDRNKMEGVDSRVLVDMLRKVFNENYGVNTIRWVTFHGIYDIAYLLKFFTGGLPLPTTLPLFAEIAGDVLGSVYDLKFMAKSCDGLEGGRLGLVRLGQLMLGDCGGHRHHRAGHDSHLTAVVFGKMNRVYNLDMGRYEGVLFCVESVRFVRRKTLVALPTVIFPTRPVMMMPQHAVAAGCTFCHDRTMVIPPRRHLHHLLPLPCYRHMLRLAFFH